MARWLGTRKGFDGSIKLRINMNSLDDYYNAPVKDWHRPYTDVKFSTGEHRTCWDCDNMRVRGFPTRACAEYPDRHIWSSLESELEESGTTIADTCENFVWNSRIKD